MIEFFVSKLDFFGTENHVFSTIVWVLPLHACVDDFTQKRCKEKMFSLLKLTANFMKLSLPPHPPPPPGPADSKCKFKPCLPSNSCTFSRKLLYSCVSWGIIKTMTNNAYLNFQRVCKAKQPLTKIETTANARKTLFMQILHFENK